MIRGLAVPFSNPVMIIWARGYEPDPWLRNLKLFLVLVIVLLKEVQCKTRAPLQVVSD
jgi:hypothetical protein